VPGSYFLRVLQEELGEEYEIRAEGRRGWTSRRWIRSGDFAEVCEGADIVLVSLGGNDRVHGRTWRSIKENVSTLVESLPSGTHVFHMTVPRYYRPRIHLASDGIHMSRRGAREYARVVAPMLLMRVAD
jgi:lysophospholipase L1-like esterase